MLAGEMSGQLKHAQSGAPHSGLCVKRGSLYSQPAYSYLYAPQLAQPGARQRFAPPVEKLSYKCARLSRRAISKCQDDSQAISTEKRIREQTTRHSKLVREVAYLQKLVDTFRKLSSAQAKVRHCPVCQKAVYTSSEVVGKRIILVSACLGPPQRIGKIRTETGNVVQVDQLLQNEKVVKFCTSCWYATVSISSHTCGFSVYSLAAECQPV